MRKLPVACDPSAFSSSDTFAMHMAEGRRLLALSLERIELSDGWAFRLANDDETLLACARWIVEERRCCPFFTFAIQSEPGTDGLTIRITGPAGAKEVLRELGHGMKKKLKAEGQKRATTDTAG
jgi:hypothetical protein